MVWTVKDNTRNKIMFTVCASLWVASSTENNLEKYQLNIILGIYKALENVICHIINRNCAMETNEMIITLCGESTVQD